MGCDRHYLYHPGEAYRVRGFATCLTGSQGFSGIVIGYGVIASPGRSSDAGTAA